MPSTVARSAKRSYDRPTSTQWALSSFAPANTATPAELRRCLTYFSFSALGVKNRPNIKPPSQAGASGLPDDLLNRPSPRRTASAPLKRIQDLSSSTKALSFICAVLPWTTKSSTVSSAGRSVNSSTRTRSDVAAACRSLRSSDAAGLPSYSARVDWRDAMALNRDVTSAAPGKSVMRTVPRVASNSGSPCRPWARAAWIRFSAAQPSETYRWWSSGSTAGQRRVKSGRIVMAACSSANLQHCELWLEGASVA
jgi:hypothetical protein